jgi:hypothetical protein
LEYNSSEHYYVCRRCSLPCDFSSHDFSSYSFSINKNLSYGETYSIFDIDVTKNCSCGYSEFSQADENLIIEEHILEYGTNEIYLSYNNHKEVIYYNPSSAANNHSDWINGVNNQRFVIEGVVTEISKNPDNNSFLILDYEGYGYLVENPTMSNEKLSPGDIVNVIGNRQYSYYKQYISEATYSILQDNNYDVLPDEYFINATNDYLNFTTKDFKSRYVYTPIILDNVYLNYNNWSNIRVNVSGKSMNVNYSNNYLSEENILLNRYSIFEYRYGSLKGLYFLIDKTYEIYTMNNVELFNYNDPISYNDMYSKDSSYFHEIMNMNYNLCEESKLELPVPIFADSYSYNVGWGDAVRIEGNTLYTDSIDGDNVWSYYIYLDLFYGTDSYRAEYWGNVNSKEAYNFNLFTMIWDSTYESSTKYELISSDSLKKATFDSYWLNVKNSYDKYGMYHSPTVSFDGINVLVDPVYGSYVTNIVELVIYFNTGEVGSREFKINTRDMQYGSYGQNFYFSEMNSDNIKYGPNGELNISLNNCKVNSDYIEIASNGSVIIDTSYGFIDYNIDINLDRYGTYESYYSSMGNWINIGDQGQYNNYTYTVYESHNFENEQYYSKNISIYNNSSYPIRLTYAYVNFLFYR